MSAHLTTGSLVGGYRIERVLGQGGMGVVYLAKDERLGRRVALKVLPAELSEDARFRERFLRESLLAAGLDHPRIVPVYDAGEADGLLYIAMRYVEGSDLRQLLRREAPLEPRRALVLLGQVADALDTAHAAGLVHRDVKPGNILLAARREGGEEHAYLADFGLAKRPASVTSLTGAAALAGTVAYAAPEQIEGAELDGRADVYALACVLYECLAGRPPFARDSELAVVFAQLQEPPPRITEARPELPQALDDVVRKGLAKRPRERYATCAELIAAATAALPGPVVTATPVRRRRVVAAVAGGAALVAAAAGTAVYVAGRPSSPPLAAPVPQVPVVARSLAVIDPRTGRVVADIRLPAAPSALAASGDSVWAASADGRSLTLVSARTRRAVRTIPLDVTPTGLAAAPDGSVWVAAGLSNEVLHVRAIADGGYGVNATPLRGCCRGPAVLAVSGRDVWVANAAGLRSLAAPDAVIPRTGVAGIAAAADGSLWLADGWETLSHVAGSRRTTIPVVASGGGAGRPAGVVYGFGEVWAVASGSDAVLEADPQSESTVSTITVGRSPEAIAAGAGAVWVANTGDGTVTRIDPVSSRAVRTIRVGQRVAAIAATAGAVWAAVQDASAGTDTGATVVSAGFEGEGPLVLSDPGGRRRRQLTDAGGPIRDHDPRWSPDGRRVVFTRTRASSVDPSAVRASELMIVSADGRTLQRLTRGPAADAQPSWAPDGRRIALQRAASPLGLDADAAVWVMRADATHARRIGPACGASSPSWSPDGTSIAFVCLSPAPRLEIMRSDGDAAHVVRAVSLSEPVPLAWAPGGAVIAFAAGASLYLVGVDGGPPTQIASIHGGGQTAIHRVHWSPDGTRLLFSDSNAVVYVGYADGSGVAEFVTYGEGPDWQPTP